MPDPEIFTPGEVLRAESVNVISEEAAAAAPADSPDFTTKVIVGVPGTNNVITITPGASPTTDSTMDTTAALSLNPGGGVVKVGTGGITASYFNSPGATVTLSGSNSPPRQAQFSANYTGSSTTTGDTTLANVSIGSPSFAASMPNGTFDELLITVNTGAGFDGGVSGMHAQLILAAPTTLSDPSHGLFGFGSKVIGQANAGGVSAGFGTTQFGIGSLFGANPWAQLKSGGTFYRQCIGQEVNASIGTGSSAADFAVQQLVVTSDHAVKGISRDAILTLAAQVGTSVGVRNIISVGDYASQWPCDPNGYVLQVQSSENLVPSTAAGGIDLNLLVASGSGLEGGGFYWRSPGVKILNGEVQIGNGSLSSSSAGLSINAPYQQMSAAAGSITVAAGGLNFTSGDIACDANGNTVIVVAAAGVVTGVSTVLTRGWQKSPPSNPVAFTARTRIGAALGTGLTLNLTWTAANHIIMASLPTSASGLASGTIWNNSGVLNIAP